MSEVSKRCFHAVAIARIFADPQLGKSLIFAGAKTNYWMHAVPLQRSIIAQRVLGLRRGC